VADPYPHPSDIDGPAGDSLAADFGLSDEEAERSSTRAPGGPGRAHGGPRRRWRASRIALIVLGVLVLAGLVIVGPTSWQVMAQRDTKLTPPQQVAGLSLDSSDDAKQTADYLRSALEVGVGLNSSVGVVYRDPGDRARSVLFFGGTEMVYFPDRELRRALALLDDAGDSLKGLHSVPGGRYGGLMQCGLSSGSDGDITVCGWADHGSVGVALFPGRGQDEAAGLMRQIRDATQQR
jgi:hypothetical protein